MGISLGWGQSSPSGLRCGLSSTKDGDPGIQSLLMICETLVAKHIARLLF